MFFGNNTIMVAFVAGVVLIFIGVGWRDKNPGMVLLGIGFLAVLYALVRKAMELFGGA
jgi:Na+/phosphate symporter